MSLLPVLRRLRADQSGLAAVEFSLWSVLFFLVALSGMDFAQFYFQRSAADEAVSAAAVSAFSTRTNVNFTDMQPYVRALAGDTGLTVTTSCNGTSGSCTNLNRTCSCLKSNGTYVAAACGSTCTGSGVTTGSTAGYYLTISATRPYQPMILPAGMVMPTRVAQKATVRLQ
ncbi:MAG: TadE/TadG family type IV pilus assembly protein [Candidatus Andeanibacterium colombiense]|uniref:TadE/TadG family type IV pilus assembly protein n=1 Tax=Candidatus Andeanibacterium colombiense TaxID=3121345 RepID=A0AAJ5X8W0_9SPHN|nr:MAG: TadE/TadG family type IV pilus assembly protein [Sphingomonadaceae bacterium]